MKPAPQLMASWNSDVLDSGRMVLIKVAMEPSVVQSEIKAMLAMIGRNSRPIKGFRPGKISESVLRRIHGKRALEETRMSLVAKSYEGAVAAAAKKHGFDPKKAPLPTSVKFSEKAGLSYEVVVTGLSLAVAAATPDAGSVVDLRKKES